MASTELKKSFSGAIGNINQNGTYLSYTFECSPTATVIAADTTIRIAEVKNGQAKADLIKQTNSSIRTFNSSIKYWQEQIAKEQAIIDDPLSNSIQKDGARRRLAEAQANKLETEKELAGAQSVLAYANSGFQADLDSLVSKAEAEQAKIDAELQAKQNPAPKPEPTTNGDGQSATPDAAAPAAENKTNDDAQTKAVPGQGQASDAIAQPSSPTSQVNAGTASSDTKSPGPVGTQQAQEKPGKRLKNPLGSFASYTYQLTLYMITPDAYDLFIQSGRKNINVLANGTNTGATPPGANIGAGAYIIAQSGGINNTTSQRAPGFETDFYIDNLKIVTSTNGKSSLTATNTTSLSFQIIEPYGFSFITKLKQAGEALKQYSDVAGYKNLSNASKQFFILGVRFQGYDINGNALTGKETLYGDPLDPQGTDNGIFEQFYDIIITKISFKLDGKAVVYNVQAAATAPQAAFGLKRGIIKAAKTVEGRTVQDMLSGPNGLFVAMTKEEEDRVKKKEIKFANTYSVEFLGDAAERIAQASIVLESDLDKWKWTGSGAQSTKDSNDATAIKTVPNPTRRQIEFNTATPVLQALSQIIGQSSYMENALKSVYKSVNEPDPKTGNPLEVKNNSPATVSWFNVTVQLSDPKWDDQSQDWAYHMTFRIQTYDTPVIFSGYSNPGMKYYGPHKRYEYWFTGQNSEVLEYSANFDNTYFNVALNTNPTENPRSTPEENAATEAGQVSVTPGLAAGDSTGKQGTGMQAQNTYITSLYDPGSFASAKLKILGDPDFLVVESSATINNVYSKFYGENGYTVSANGGQVFVEIDFKEAVDYKNSTGTMSINDSILFWQYPPEIAKEIKGVSYMVIQVTSNFASGRFVQDLDLTINTFPNTPLENTAKDLTFGREQATQSGNPGAAPGDTKASSGTTGLKPEPSSPKPSPSGPTTSPVTSSSVVPQAGSSTNDDNLPIGTGQTPPPVQQDGGRE